MKIISPSVDLKTWTLKFNCSNCKSDLEIEATDIYYDWNNALSPWRIQCCLCNFVSRLKEDQVPKIVQADVLKNRYIEHPCSDW